MERRRAVIIAAALIALAAFVGLAVALNRSSPEGEKKDTTAPAPDATSEPSTPAGTVDSVPAVIEPQELAAAHTVMREYLITLGTYTYRTDAAAWTAKARELTDGSPAIVDQTTLPTGRAWAECERTKCSSTATADLKRDTVISNAPVDGAGRSVTTLASTTVRLHQEEQTSQSTDFQITATYTKGEWKISGLQLAGVGDAGTTESS
ncbi:hypothetical protein ACIP93_31025 [Streptomyces sp. NPDC088745]|uniref:hypothetical protein n=1 Tax=Streptomyces sp. NPDC088745 TaxID=3365884 RepID=UPI00381F6373